jgi:hypothetical protein
MDSQDRKKNPSAFLRNIFQILQVFVLFSHQNPHLAEHVEWTSSGNGFVIKDLTYFEEHILPQYFKHKKYSSFVRQVSIFLI